MSEFVTAAEAAEMLGCSDTQIRRRIREGKLTATKRGGEWQIARDYLNGLTVADVRPTDRQTEVTGRQADDHTDRQTTTPTDRQTGVAKDGQTDRPADRQTDPPTDRQTTQRSREWRDDLLAQVARLEADKVDASGRLDEAVRREAEAGLREERSKARIIDLERELTVRDSRMTDMQTHVAALRDQRDKQVADMQDAHGAEVAKLRGQVAVLEAKVREVLEDGKSEAVRLADRIADLVVAQQDMHARVIELQPVAERVPQLQAAVEETTAALTERERELGNIRNDIGAISSRPVTGPVFRLLTKGKLRR